ncbi:MAG: STAS domain-containing protein [Actinomycetota bacterium]|nr:STAS domain-containing protein [Actinomycetota bacterium]
MAAAVLSPTARTDCSVAVVRADGAHTIVVLRGEWDFFTRPVLSDVLSRVIALPVGDVVIDLAEAEFIDSATARVLAVSWQWLDRRGRALTFRSPSNLAAKVLDQFGLTDLIEARDRAQP